MTRTPKQIAANKLDLQMARMAYALVVFGTTHGDIKVRETGNLISSLRTRVRAHMHPRDREEASQ